MHEVFDRFLTTNLDFIRTVTVTGRERARERGREGGKGRGIWEVRREGGLLLRRQRTRRQRVRPWRCGGCEAREGGAHDQQLLLSSIFIKSVSISFLFYRAPPAVPRLQECCRHFEAKVVSNNRNKIHQTWERPYTPALHIPKK